MPSKRNFWGKDTFVDFEHGLNFCIRQIRSALGEDAKRPRFIETLPRRGYRFIPEVSNHRNGQRGSVHPPRSDAAPQLSKIEQAVPSVAVLEFENISGDRNIDWLATGLAETLATDLRKLHSIRVVSSDRIRVVLQQAGSLKSPLSNIDYGFLAKRIGANWVVAGSYQRDGGRVRVISRLYEAGTDEICAIKVDGAWDGIFKLQDRIVRELIAALRLTVDTSEKRRVTALQTGYVEAYEEYSKGRNKFREWAKER